MGQNDPDIQIEIKTTGAAQAKKDIQDVANSTKNVGKEAASSLKQVEAFGKQIASAYRESGGGVKGLFSAITAGGAAAAGILASVAGAAALAAKAIHQYAENEEALTKLNQAVANQGRLTEHYSKQLRELASQMEEGTAIAGERWLGVLEQLTKHGANADNIEEYAKAVENLAGLMGGDVEDAARIFARAMHGNFEQLHRLGITIKENVSLHEQLIDIQKQLAEMGGGILHSRLKTVNGSFTEMGLAVNNVFQELGYLIDRLLFVTPALALQARLLEWLNKLFPQTAANVDNLKNRIPPTTAAINDGNAALQANAEALKDISKQYDEAARAADEYRKQQEESDDATLENQLAKIDNQLARGEIDEPTAQAASSYFRTSSRNRKAASKVTSFREEEDSLRAQESQAFTKYSNADQAAGERSKKVEALKQIAREYGIADPTDPRQIELFVNQAVAEGRAGKDIGKIRGIPGAIEDERSAKIEAARAKQEYEDTFAQTSPRRVELERQSRLESLRGQTGGVQANTELINLAKNGGIDASRVQNAVTRAIGNVQSQFDQLGDAVANPIMELNKTIIDLRKRLQTVEKQVSNQRNK
jgi:hypothetical protein